MFAVKFLNMIIFIVSEWLVPFVFSILFKNEKNLYVGS